MAARPPTARPEFAAENRQAIHVDLRRSPVEPNDLPVEEGSRAPTNRAANNVAGRRYNA